ncbi:MAG TPA: metallophosphoesterase [bacterium]|jgi:hypothetical protein
MSETHSQSTYEKVIAALLVLAMALAGWGPFVLESLKLPFIERFLMPVSLAFAVIALGLIYDAAERLLGNGRGLYAAALLCSLPATGMVGADPGMLQDSALMMVGAVGIWMASRARGEERPFFLGFIGVLLVGAGYAFGWRSGAIALAFAALLAARQGKHAVVWSVVLMICYGLGAAIHGLMPLTLPVPDSVIPPQSVMVWQALLPLLPWGLFIFPALWALLKRSTSAKPWWADACAVTVMAVVATLLSGESMVKAAAAVAPLIALLGADMVWTDFRDEFAAARKRLTTLPGVLTVVILVLLPLLSALHIQGNPTVAVWQGIMAVVLATALAWTISQNLPRWSFVLMFAAGILLARLANQSESLVFDPGAAAPAGIALLPLLMVLMAGGAVWLIFFLLLRRGEKPTQDGDYLFSGENFRRFTALKRDGQGGETVALQATLDSTYSFAIFGDVTGAESPFSTRRSGFLAFRALMRKLAEDRPAFAVSLGDLASQATRYSYQRIHSLLRQIPVPLAVTPGNHDLLTQGEREHRYFHQLFGADNAAFRIGPVQFIILNNGWGSIQPQQFVWLEKVLPEKPAPYTLVFCHKPPFELRQDVFYAMENREHAARLHSILRKRGATAVFSGHIHSLLSEMRDGVTYVISGGGGSKLLSAGDQYHYLSVTVSDTELVVRALPLSSRGAGSSPLLELRFAPRT